MYIIHFHEFLHNNITFLYFFLYCYIVKFHFSFLSNTSMEQSDQFMKFYISRQIRYGGNDEILKANRANPF